MALIGPPYLQLLCSKDIRIRIFQIQKGKIQMESKMLFHKHNKHCKMHLLMELHSEWLRAKCSKFKLYSLILLTLS